MLENSVKYQRRKQSSRGKTVRAVGLSLLAAFLVWEVIARSFGAYLAEVAPEGSRLLRSGNISAILSVSKKKLQDSLNEKSQDPTKVYDLSAGKKYELRKDLRLVLMSNPLSAPAYRMLGQLSEADGNGELAERFMRSASRRSLQESYAIYWLMNKSFEKKNYEDVLRYADVILRTRPQFITEVMPFLAASAEIESARIHLVQYLRRNPPWRRHFFGSLAGQVSDARVPLEMLLSLRDSRTPPTKEEVNNFIQFVVNKGFYELGYYAWLQFLPVDQLRNVGLLYNGSFEIEPSGSPFDWAIGAGPGVLVEVSELPDKPAQRALHIEFGLGRADFRGVTQVVMLSPGQYRFKGKYKGRVMGQRGLRWRITCVGSNQIQLGETPMVVGNYSDWKRFEYLFEVPEDNCQAQVISLLFDARSASERFVTGSIFYDELEIIRNSEKSSK